MMSPVCAVSPIVTVPLASVVMRVNSVSVRLMPVTAVFVSPRAIGRVLCDERTTKPPPAPVALTFVPVVAVRSISAPRSVIALVDVLAEVTLPVVVMVNVPVPSSPAPAAVRSAPRLIVPVPVVIVAPATTTRFARDVTSTPVLAVFPVILPSVKLPRPSRYTLLA